MENGRSWISELAVRDEWLDLVKEDIIWPNLKIIDPHHHLWKRQKSVYEVDQFMNDAGSGHNIIKTVYIECGAYYLENGPDYLKSLGEVQHITKIIESSKETSERSIISGIVSKVDLRSEGLRGLLGKHLKVAGKSLKGVRHSAAFSQDSLPYSIPGLGPSNLYLDPSYQYGANILGELNLSLDCWHYFAQSNEFLKFLDHVTNTTIILNHFGMPVGLGSTRYTGKLFDSWKYFINKISKKPNVFLKLGGLGMVDIGWGFHNRSEPIGSEEFSNLIKPMVIYAINALGPDRCMFESNFPVDRVSLSYHVLWNSFKRICLQFDKKSIEALFSGTAKKVYNL